MGVAVGRGAAALVHGRVVVGAPAPVARSDHVGRRVGGLDRLRRRQGLRPELALGQRVRVDVAVGAVPEVGLVVELVEADPSVRRRAVRRHQVAAPSARRSAGPATVEVVAGSAVRRRAAVDAVAAVAVPVVEVVLGREDGLGEGAGEGVLAGESFDTQPIIGTVTRLLECRRAVGAHQRVERAAAARDDVLEVPVRPGVVGVVGVVVATRAVAAPAVDRHLERRTESGHLGGEVDPVDERADRVPAGGRVDREGHRVRRLASYR